MAAAWRISVFLIALLIAGAVFGVLDIPAEIIDPIALDFAETQQTQQLYQWTGSLWAISPVIILLAAGAWLLKQGVIVSG